MVNIYLYRKLNFDFTRYPNPYIFNLENSLSQYFNIVNKKDNKAGVADVFRYLFKTKIFYFNWIEILPQARFGKLQAVFFYIFLFVSKGFGKKIVWTLHNKYSHAKDRNYWTDFMYDILMKHADLILTHSQSGVNFVKAKYPNHVFKTKYIIHPIMNILPVSPGKEKKYDFLIWGGIHPYKGIVEFLRFVKDSKDMKSFKILIVGKCVDEKYKTMIGEYLCENITYHDEFYGIEEISAFANESKFILFTYKLTSTLSSGSLMDSIRMRAVIIAPNDGAFKDLSCYNFIYTYDNFDELAEIYRNHSDAKTNNFPEIEEFCRANTWRAFGDKLKYELECL